MARKQPSNFAFAVYDSVAMIHQEHWKEVEQYGSEFLQLDYLSVFENNPPKNIRFHYALIYENKKPVAIAYFQAIDFSSESFGSALTEKDEDGCCVADYIKKHIKSHLLRSADHFNMRLLICGNACISGEHGFAVVPTVDKKLAFDALADIIYRISRSEKLRGKIAAVLVKDFYNSTLEFSNELDEFKYHDFLVEPNMIVPIGWNSFDAYLNAMSKKYRSRAKSIIKKGEALKRKIFTADDIQQHSTVIEQLYLNVHLKAKFRMATLTPAYFIEMKNRLADRFTFEGYFIGDSLVGFRSAFVLKNDLEAHFIGLNYELNKEFELYQNVLYDYVNQAIQCGSQKLYLGRTASEIKSNVGAQAHELTCYIRHRNPLSNRIIKPFIDYLKPSEWIPRNPFKEISI
jgi:hypothetical protein